MLCPVGIRIFADALANVARSNGLDPTGGRGGTAASPTGSRFSKGSNAHPGARDHFQRAFAGCGSDLASSWSWRSCSRSSRNSEPTQSDLPNRAHGLSGRSITRNADRSCALRA